MTTHHNIHLVKSSTDLKLTYRNGKFVQIKHLRGLFDAQMIKYIGFVIPPRETDLELFIDEQKGNVVYSSEIKVESLYSKFNSAWFTFYRKNNNYIDPKFTGADGTALKQIITYLTKINNGDEARSLANWKLILDNWENLSEFHQKQMDLKYINSKLNVIIREIIREKGNSTRAGGSVRL